MPVGIARGHDVTAGRVDRHRRIDGEAELDELVDELVPRLASTRVDLIPQPGDLTEAVLFVALVLVDRPILDVVVFEECFEQTVKVRLGAEAEPCSVEHVHASHAVLPEMRHRAEIMQLGLVE